MGPPATDDLIIRLLVGAFVPLYHIVYLDTMNSIQTLSRLIHEARQQTGVTQRELAARVGTSQSAIAKLEQGATNPTIETLERCAAAVGFALQVTLVPLAKNDPVVERYKQDVDRTLLRDNLRKSVDKRVRTLGEWQQVGRALQRATRAARRRK
jgi:transcriptional regulator with XRE-family HTH domain